MQGLKPMLLLAAFGLAACGGSSSPGIAPAPAEQPPGLLSPVGDDAAFELSIKQGLARMTGSDVLESAGTADQAGFTGTYTQELGVDEADTVRYDGEHLIVAPRRYFSCCFVFDNAFASPLQPPPSAIRILKTDPDNGTAELVGEIGLAEGTSVQGLYQTADTLFALTAQRFYGSYGGLWADIAIWAPETLGLEVHDLADPAEPELFKARQRLHLLPYARGQRSHENTIILSGYDDFDRRPRVAGLRLHQRAQADVLLDNLGPKRLDLCNIVQRVGTLVRAPRDEIDDVAFDLAGVILRQLKRILKTGLRHVVDVEHRE
jgi:hypothetical protein